MSGNKGHIGSVVLGESDSVTVGPWEGVGDERRQRPAGSMEKHQLFSYSKVRGHMVNKSGLTDANCLM